MNVEVGGQLRWMGHPVVCTSICQCEETRIAPRDSRAMREDMQMLGNCKYLEMKMEEFDEGDVITIKYERVELTEIGKNLWHLYPRYVVEKRREKTV